MVDKLKELISKCKCGVYVTINENRDSYQSVTDALMEFSQHECPPEITKEIHEKMIETDTIIEVQFYPDTPVGFYDVYHYDLDMALTEALAIAEKESKETK